MVVNDRHDDFRLGRLAAASKRDLDEIALVATYIRANIRRGLDLIFFGV
jgi:hypothetical protein